MDSPLDRSKETLILMFDLGVASPHNSESHTAQRITNTSSGEDLPQSLCGRALGGRSPLPDEKN